MLLYVFTVRRSFIPNDVSFICVDIHDDDDDDDDDGHDDDSSDDDDGHNDDDDGHDNDDGHDDDDECDGIAAVTVLHQFIIIIIITYLH